MGDSRKYPYLYHGRLLGFPKGTGGGGFFELEFRRNRGIFTIGNPKAWGDFTGGISQGGFHTGILQGDFTGGISEVERVE